MKINVKVTTLATREEVFKQGDVYNVRVKEPPREGKANEAVIKVLAGHFRVPKSAVRIVSGQFSHNKIVEIRAG
ncbi:MAG: DUF167 domain-containing protein [Dehalococcoidia bacterium]|nr:DUF167 domain-containing protein [Dehalococcoidia bacterium]MDD5494781.1 DUF167 domain-containing protein [Dehalococcoidia bacterium]